jgi:NADPH:quinone reductase-like Zn-dependent oxidoreductase
MSQKIMKAIIWTKYGPPEVLQLKDVEKPTAKDNEILVKIHATTVTAGDCEMRSLAFPLALKLPLRLYSGISKPKRITILGQEFAGEIEAVGKEVSLFKAGDQIFGTSEFGFGTYAQFTCLPEKSVVAIKPSNMTFEEAATIPVGGLNALHFLRKANIQNGQEVLINGAGGSIGTVAVQFAKSHGANVAAVDSTNKLDMLRSIGADRVIDYTQEDFTKRDETYDVIFDVIGKASISGSLNSLKENGLYLLGNPSLSKSLKGSLSSRKSDKKVISGTADYSARDLAYLKELIEEGKIKAVIDKRYPLEQIVDAHRYVETGQKTGNVVINVSHGNKK